MGSNPRHTAWEADIRPSRLPRHRRTTVSDHRDTPDPRTDITDLYVFQAPGGGGARSVLVLNINPDANALKPSFDPDASYELKIDTDGDLEPPKLPRLQA